MPIEYKHKTTEQYWKDRFLKATSAGEKKADELLRDMQKVYEKSLAELQKEIEAFYGRYATENGLTMQEVHKRLNPKELKSAIAEIKRYYEFAKPEKIGSEMSEEYRDELRRLSARAYMSRLEEIKARLKHEVVKLAAEQEQKLGDELKETYSDSHAEASFNIDVQRGYSEGYSAPDNDVLEKVVKEKWLGENYSDRIWKDKGRLLTSIETELLSGIAQGHNPRKIADAMSEKYAQNYRNCERLARTETIHAMNAATAAAYKAHGIEKYQFVCDLSERTCAICGALDGEVFDLKYKTEGVNYPVIHPRCRCTTVPAFEKDEIDAMFEEDTRLAYDKKRKIYAIPENMTYKDWKVGKSGEEKFSGRKIFTGKNGGSIIANYKKPTPEEKENIAALKTFAEKGEKVVLIKANNAVRTADCTINGISWEVKTNKRPTMSALDNEIRSCNGQSKNLILNIKSGVSIEIIEKALLGRIHRTNIEKIIVERNGIIEKEYTRDEFIKK